MIIGFLCLLIGMMIVYIYHIKTVSKSRKRKGVFSNTFWNIKDKEDDPINYKRWNVWYEIEELYVVDKKTKVKIINCWSERDCDKKSDIDFYIKFIENNYGNFILTKSIMFENIEKKKRIDKLNHIYEKIDKL
jgi:hypothetical protein